VPAAARAETSSLISNLANPAIGLNALVRGDAVPRLDRPYGVRFEEAELSVLSVVDPYWTLAANLVFTPAGADPEEVYATTAAVPGVGLKVGKFRGTFGKHGTLHTHAFPFVEPPLIMANSIGEEGFKDSGIEAAWLSPLPWYCELTAGSFLAAGIDADHPLDLGSASHGNLPALAHLKNLFDVTDDSTLEAGGSVLTGMGADGLHHTAAGADLTFKDVPLRQSNQRGFIAQAEYLRRESSGAVDPVDPARRTRRDADGWYGSVQVRWSQVWWTGLRVEDALHVTNDVLDQWAAGTGRIRKVSANVAWVASEFSVIRLEGAAARIMPDDGGPAVLDTRAIIQANFTIGFHPPHAY
jgi:hypothetical protein